MDPIKITIDSSILEKMKKFYDSHMQICDEPNYEFLAKTVGCEIICYKNLTVSFMGPNAINEVGHWKRLRPKDHCDENGLYIGNHIGVSEYGSHDYFGPICVVSCYVDEKDIDWLKSLNFLPATELEDKDIVRISKEIKDRIVYSLLILDNVHYNHAIKEGANQSNLKARLYNDAVVNVMQKIQKTVDKKVGRQFVATKTYYNYLKNEVIVAKDVEFCENAEATYFAAATSYILAKYAYMQYYAKICNTLKMKLPLGTSTAVDVAGAKLVKKYGEKTLVKVAKVNLNNTRHIKNLLQKNKQDAN